MEKYNMKRSIPAKGGYRPVGLVFVVALTLEACASASGTADTPPAERFRAYLDQCTAQYGYSPDAVQGVGEHELAPNELAWRACAYKGIETVLIPRASMPDLYRLLITEDRAMTEAVTVGTMTRQQRRDRIEKLFAEVSSQETEMQAQEAAQMRLAVDGLRR